MLSHAARVGRQRVAALGAAEEHLLKANATLAFEAFRVFVAVRLELFARGHSILGYECQCLPRAIEETRAHDRVVLVHPHVEGALVERGVVLGRLGLDEAHVAHEVAEHDGVAAVPAVAPRLVEENRLANDPLDLCFACFRGDANRDLRPFDTSPLVERFGAKEEPADQKVVEKRAEHQPGGWYQIGELQARSWMTGCTRPTQQRASSSGRSSGFVQSTLSHQSTFRPALGSQQSQR